MDYIGCECPVCKKAFHADDDIVVCPECGAPHHRECYEYEGHCHFENQHKDGYEFKAAGDEPSHDNSNTLKCRSCGAENPGDALFCSHCGTPIQQDGQQRKNGQAVDNNQFYGQAKTVNMNAMSPDDKFEEGVTVEDVTKYVQNSVPYYMRVFQNIKRFSKSRFNFAAFLFSGGFLLYRKQYKKGIIITVIMALLMLASTIISFSSAYAEMASELYSAAGDLTSFTDIINVYASLDKLSTGQVVIFYLPSLFQLIEYVIMFYLGLTTNRSYYNSCIREVQKIKASAGNRAEADNLLKARGGVNVALAVSIFVVYLAITYLPYLFV